MKTTILFLLILFLADSRHPHSFDGIRKPESQLSESYYSLFEYKHLPSKAVSSWKRSITKGDRLIAEEFENPRRLAELLYIFSIIVGAGMLFLSFF
jgi:hypothetical protein